MTAARLEELAVWAHDQSLEQKLYGSSVEADYLADLARCARGMQSAAYRLHQLEAMNAGLLKLLGNIRIACKPGNMKGPDGKEWTYHPTEEMIRLHWEHLSKYVMDALEAVEAAEVGK